ncbi:MAG: orotidine-5'-phosphate decarboxylase [Clostridiales Family XIII bacterium]|nr:orotidine-5'-phosphate decarboxylase [Clostridiales Family XIII bacterium]
MDRLIERIDELKSPVVVGLDPTEGVVPESYIKEAVEEVELNKMAVATAYFRFGCEIIDAIADIVPAVKPNIAFYEALGYEGIGAYIETVKYAKSKGLIVIGDIKRGDIGSTAESYATHIGFTHAAGHDFKVWCEDFVTLNPYLGYDSIEPFAKVLSELERGIFMLVKTSNKSSKDIQDLPIAYTTLGTLPLYEYVGGLVNHWGKDFVGKYGYSKIGAVVGATHPEEGERLRHTMDNTFFLVPGYGAQGGSAADLRGFFDKNGRGCIVNSSRGIIGAWKNSSGASVGEAARAAAISMRDDLNSVL